MDVIEIDAATNRGIDEIRELRDAARYRPARDRYKIYILDEAHQITDAAFNALLKTLEEPPPHIIFMMATTQPEDIPQTIRSRCQHFSFHAVSSTTSLASCARSPRKKTFTTDDEALAMLAEAGDGSMRDALSIMDQAIACCGTKLSGELVRGLVGNVGSEVFEDLMGTVARSSSEEALRTLDRLMTEGTKQRILPGSWCASCAIRWWPKLQERFSVAADFLRRAGTRGSRGNASFLKKTWHGFSRSCCVPSTNSATGRSSVSISNWAC